MACKQQVVIGTLESDAMIMENPFGLGTDGRNPAYVADVSFRAHFIRSGKSIDAGTVSIEDTTLKHHDGEYTAVSGRIGWFGRMQHWRVSGSSECPAFDDSLVAPNAFHITSPHPRVDTISRSKGFKITYDDPGTDSVEMTVWYDSIGTAAFLDSTIHHPRAVLDVRVKNSGSYSVGSSQLASFPTEGQCQIMITAVGSKTHRMDGGSFELTARSRARSYFMIKP